MKTDKEKLTELLDSFEVEYEDHNSIHHSRVDSMITCKGDNNIGGNMRFSTDFDFDKDGKFIKMGVWE